MSEKMKLEPPDWPRHAEDAAGWVINTYVPWYEEHVAPVPAQGTPPAPHVNARLVDGGRLHPKPYDGSDMQVWPDAPALASPQGAETLEQECYRWLRDNDQDCTGYEIESLVKFIRTKLRAALAQNEKLSALADLYDAECIELREQVAAAREEALEEAANVIANEIRLREMTHDASGHAFDHMRPISELEADIRALAAQPTPAPKEQQK